LLASDHHLRQRDLAREPGQGEGLDGPALRFNVYLPADAAAAALLASIIQR
jgi:hypothetical protein